MSEQAEGVQELPAMTVRPAIGVVVSIVVASLGAAAILMLASWLLTGGA